MAWFTRMLTSSIGKKFVMSVTGLFLCLFLVIHLTINIMALIPDGGATFNKWAHFMGSNFFIRAMEIVLFAGIILHIIQSLISTIDNRKARPKPYAENHPQANSKWYSRSMGLLGSLILIFLVVHLRNFWVVSRFVGYPEDAHGSPNQFADFAVHFSNPWMVGLYVIGVAALAFHLLHGFQSAWRTLGFMHRKWTPIIVWVGYIYTFVICVGLGIIPLYFLFTQSTSDIAWR